MAKKVEAIVVLVTCKSKAEARKIVMALVKNRIGGVRKYFGVAGDFDLSVEGEN